MLRLLVIPLGLFVLLAGFIYFSGGTRQKRADLVFIDRGDINTLDTNTMTYMQDFRVMYGIREGLYSPEPLTLRPIPAVAAGYDLSPDKKVWTFHLRKEAKWSNGDPVTSHDFVFSWRRMLEEPGEYSYLFYYLKNSEDYKKAFAEGKPMKFSDVGAEAVDDYTFKVTLTNPVPYLLELAAFPPFYPRHEKSMAPFRVFSDSSSAGDDVMDIFQKCLNAAHSATSVEQFNELAHTSAAANAANKWLSAAKTFETQNATEAQLMPMLRLFAALKALPHSPPALTEDAPAQDYFRSLPRDEKLERMLDVGFIRYIFNKAYTIPPALVTNGPYVLSRWDFRRRLLLDKSPTYWDRQHVPTDSIDIEVVDNDATKLLMYGSGEADWLADIGNDEAAEMKKLGRTDLHSSPAFGTSFLEIMSAPQLPKSLGGGKNPCADMRVRQALAMAIDKQFIVDNITRMGELPARTYLPPDGTLPKFVWQPGPDDPKGTKPYTFKQMQQMLRSPEGLTGPGAGLPYNPAKARQLLAEAGYPNGQGFPRLPILFNSDNRQRRSICQALQSQWKRQLNIDIDIGQLEVKVFADQTHAKDFWICTAAWYGDYPDISTFTDKYLSNSLQNDSAWVNNDYDHLCDLATRELDENKRIDLLSRAEDLIDTQVPVIPLYHYVNLNVSGPNVHGVMPNPRGVTVFKGVWIDKTRGAGR